MKNRLKEIIEIVVIFLLCLLLAAPNFLSSLDYMVKDRLYQAPRGIDTKIKIIAIDEKTLNELGPISTWSRIYYADLIEKLTENEESSPSIIAFDLIFSGHVDEDGDMAFARKAEEAGNVVVASQIIYKQKFEIVDGMTVYPIDYVIYPYSELSLVTTTGYANVSQDSDGIVRRVVLKETLPTDTVQVESAGNSNATELSMFSYEIYSKYCSNKGIEENEIAVDKSGRSIINYSGNPGDYEAISFIDILNGKIDARAFTDCIVLVGAYAPGMQDNFKVPNGYSQQMYGVEIHANILQSYMQNRFAVMASPFPVALVMAIICVIIYVIAKRLKLWQSLVLTIGAGALWLCACVAINNKGMVISPIYVPVMLILSYLYILAMSYVLERVRRNRVLGAFKKYVAPEIVEELSKKGDFQIKVGGENRDIAVLFVDVRGFTTMSESLQPEQVVEILNQYLDMATQAIFKNKGTLDKFVGDAVMAVFNSPFDLDDYEFRAVCAAIDIVNGGIELEKKLIEQYGRSVGFGVGVNVGPAVVGNIGSDFRMDYTAIGDTVNTAARLEANAKKGQVLISEELYERIKDRVTAVSIGAIPLKGKSKEFCVYSVTEVHRD